jgi:hypothetical protein
MTSRAGRDRLSDPTSKRRNEMMRKLTEATLVEKAAERGYLLKRGDIYGKGYVLDRNDGTPGVAFTGRSKSTLWQVDVVLDGIPTIAEVKAFDAVATKAAPGSESMQ